jgi:hypothetical protein
MDFETELFPSVYITDGIFPSVIPLLFSGFLVVIPEYGGEEKKKKKKKKKGDESVVKLGILGFLFMCLPMDN